MLSLKLVKYLRKPQILQIFGIFLQIFDIFLKILLTFLRILNTFLHILTKKVGQDAFIFISDNALNF